jgi:hypothetical protein
MPELAIVGLVIAFPIIGLLTRHWIAGILPPVAWPLYFLGLTEGWWGDGTGDGWPYGAIVLTALGTLTTALAIAAARFLEMRATMPRSPGRRGHTVP